MLLCWEDLKIINLPDEQITKILTETTHSGMPHSVLSTLWLFNTPFSTFLSTTSSPFTFGFNGLGYFCQTALVTVSQGWLEKLYTKLKYKINIVWIKTSKITVKIYYVITSCDMNCIQPFTIWCVLRQADTD